MKSESQSKDNDHEDKIKLLVTESNKLLQSTKVYDIFYVNRMRQVKKFWR